MNRIIIPLLIFPFLWAQEEMAESSADSLAEQEQENTVPGLEFGYKGYQWGATIGDVPTMENFSEAVINAEQTLAQMRGTLGLDTVVVNYVYSDSGFWKVEIDFDVDEQDVDAQIEKFLRIERNISEVYGNPYSTEQTVNGPSNSYNNYLNIKYARSFYSSAWNVSPTRIILVLNGVIQQPQTKNSILEGHLSFLKLVYYNPDYMKYTDEESQAEDLPSIYDIY